MIAATSATAIDRERRRDPDEPISHQHSSSRNDATAESSSVQPMARSSAPIRAVIA
jgi:hypothetical protein